ncbi:MAG: DUF1538 domain-containing protein [Clostridia bacterium]|nr:DUF1538 domain-containing protein [Clostridia bacterium]
MSFTRTILKDKIRESLASVLPVTGIVLLLCFTVAPIPTDAMLAFLFGAVMLIFGMGLFTLGADTAMTPIGEYVGSSITRSKRLWFIVGVALFVGIMITVSEPDLQVLAEQVPTIPNMTLILAVGIGVGVFLVIAMLRILFRVKLSYLLIGFYLVCFGLAAFVPADFLAVSFDAGGVTTGPMTVPFIMALGVGVASIRSDKHSEDDSFGLVSLCSVGPIMAVLILGLVFRPTESAYSTVDAIEAGDSRELVRLFVEAIPHYMWEVFISLAPIVIFFLIFQFFAGRLPGKKLAKIGIGVGYTYVGLVLFLTGVNVGFMPAGHYLGQLMGGMKFNFIIIPIGMVIGYFIVKAEPAVHVLTEQVDRITSGTIPPNLLMQTLSIGVSISVGLALTRVLTGISIMWFLIPGYAIALILTFFVPPIFTAIAFDSGGVASGPMTATFLLPFAMGACSAVGGNIITDAFGIVAMVAMTPLIAIQILGLIYRIKTARAAVAETPAQPVEPIEDDIIDL